MIAQFGFDTLAFVKRLSAAGMDTRQAEALAEALTGHAFNELVTKSDLKNEIYALRAELKQEIQDLRAELKQEIQDLRAELKGEMKELELRLTMRMGAMSAASTALTVAILGALITLS